MRCGDYLEECIRNVRKYPAIGKLRKATLIKTEEIDFEAIGGETDTGCYSPRFSPMGPRARLCLYLVALVGSATLLTMNGCGSNFAVPPGKIAHVVIVIQENRTPDNLFHDPVLMRAGADIASSGVDSAGRTVPLTPVALGTTYDLSHEHSAFVAMYNQGRMNGANHVQIYCNSKRCPPADPQFRYVNPADVQPYFQIAEQYAFADRMFQTNEGPSFPAHQFLLSGTSAPTAHSPLFMAENTGFLDAGCTASPTETVILIGPNGKENSTMYPCTDHPTLTDELNARNISWRYYTPSATSIWTAPNAIEHMCGPNVPPPNATTCTGSDWKNHVVIYNKKDPAPILTDIANLQLPSVSWVIPSGQNSDHPGAKGGTGGPSWVAAVVNAIGNSPYWDNTAIIVTWDDWGGWFDHVPPPEVINDGKSWGSGYIYGFRVPLIVISPYAKAHYISHTRHDFGSILNFVEGVFRLPSLGYADAHADNLSDCFDFGQKQLVFKTIDAPLSAEHFLHDTTPPSDPDDY